MNNYNNKYIYKTKTKWKEKLKRTEKKVNKGKVINRRRQDLPIWEGQKLHWNQADKIWGEVAGLWRVQLWLRLTGTCSSSVCINAATKQYSLCVFCIHSTKKWFGYQLMLKHFFSRGTLTKNTPLCPPPTISTSFLTYLCLNAWQCFKYDPN